MYKLCERLLFSYISLYSSSWVGCLTSVDLNISQVDLELSFSFSHSIPWRAQEIAKLCFRTGSCFQGRLSWNTDKCRPSKGVVEAAVSWAPWGLCYSFNFMCMGILLACISVQVCVCLEPAEVIRETHTGKHTHRQTFIHTKKWHRMRMHPC